MYNSIFIGCFCVVFHCNTYELYRLFSTQIVIHIGLSTKCSMTSIIRSPLSEPSVIRTPFHILKSFDFLQSHIINETPV